MHHGSLRVFRLAPEARREQRKKGSPIVFSLSVGAPNRGGTGVIRHPGGTLESFQLGHSERRKDGRGTKVYQSIRQYTNMYNL